MRELLRVVSSQRISQRNSSLTLSIVKAHRHEFKDLPFKDQQKELGKKVSIIVLSRSTVIVFATPMPPISPSHLILLHVLQSSHDCLHSQGRGTGALSHYLNV
jgi:hypothetical protein